MTEIEQIKHALSTFIFWSAQSANAPISSAESDRLIKMLHVKPGDAETLVKHSTMVSQIAAAVEHAKRETARRCAEIAISVGRDRNTNACMACANRILDTIEVEFGL